MTTKLYHPDAKAHHEALKTWLTDNDVTFVDDWTDIQLGLGTAEDGDDTEVRSHAAVMLAPAVGHDEPAVIVVSPDGYRFRAPDGPMLPLGIALDLDAIAARVANLSTSDWVLAPADVAEPVWSETVERAAAFPEVVTDVPVTEAPDEETPEEE